MTDRPVEMVIESVRVHLLSTTHVVLLREEGGARYLPIWIGAWEANAIAMRLQGVTPERPLTHDLLVSTIDALHGVVREVRIVALADDTFHARLVVGGAGDDHEIDARPSDALAVAVRTGVRIFVDESVLERAGVRPEPGVEPGDAALAADAQAPTEEHLAIFRDFVNSLDREPGDEQREGPRPPDPA